MKVRPSLTSLRAVLVIALATGFLGIGSPQAAAYYVPRGNTTLAFAPQFFNLFPALGADLTDIRPGRLRGTLNAQNLRALFPVTTGLLDNVASVAEIEHSGGLTIRTGSGLIVQLTAVTLQFDLPPARSGRVLSALLAVNGEIFGRFPIFNMEATGLGGTVKAGRLRLRNVPVTLTEQAANLFNQIFGLPGPSGGRFFAGQMAGTVTVHGQNLRGVTRL